MSSEARSRGGSYRLDGCFAVLAPNARVIHLSMRSVAGRCSRAVRFRFGDRVVWFAVVVELLPLCRFAWAAFWGRVDCLRASARSQAEQDQRVDADWVGGYGWDSGGGGGLEPLATLTFVLVLAVEFSRLPLIQGREFWGEWRFLFPLFCCITTGCDPTCGDGSSPRRRGTRSAEPRRPVRTRFIPAQAGNTPPRALR